MQHGDLSGHDRHGRLHRSNGQLLLARWVGTSEGTFKGALRDLAWFLCVFFFVSNRFDPLAAS